MVSRPSGDLDPVDPFQALGDANRQRIVELLADGPRSVGELAAAMPISRPAISRHLRLLKEARLVVDTPQGTRRIYRLDGEGAEVVEAWVTQMWGEALTRFVLTAQNTVPGRRASASADAATTGHAADQGSDQAPGSAPGSDLGAAPEGSSDRSSGPGSRGSADGDDSPVPAA